MIMAGTSFIYVTYIRAPQQKVWDALTKPEFQNAPRRLALKWRNEFKPEFKAEGYTRCVMSLEYDGELTRLTIDHSIDREGARIITEGVSGGWPKILSSLKSMLETGDPLERFKR